MFGYLTADVFSLDKELKRQYRSFYCGLCEMLNKSYGNQGRLTLSYDLTFVGILLSDIYKEEIVYTKKHCPIHPLTKIEARYSKSFEFASDMNILLTYYKALDDVNDDHSRRAKKKADRLKPFVDQIEQKYPEKTLKIKTGLEEISKMEADNVLNPDLPANAFGSIMAELFYIEQDEYTELLKGFGFHLGRFIYLVDAICDLKKDLKSASYNPLVAMENLDGEAVLTIVLNEADYFYKQLPLDKYKKMTDNIIYTGLWSKFDQHKTLERKK